MRPIRSAEASDEGNNVSAAALTIALAPYPDLTVTQVVGPEGLVVGDLAEIEVGWTVRNVGAGDTGSQPWTDRVVLSSNAVIGDGDDKVLGEFLAAVRWPPTARTAGRRPSRCRSAPRAAFYVGVVTDALKQVFEYPREDNNTGLSAHFEVAGARRRPTW